MSKASSRDVKISKLLSYVLRHRPDAIGLTLDDGGWVAVDRLLECLASSGTPVTQADLERTVETSDKQRFALSPDRRRIRANQGHSLAVDLKLPEAAPPPHLFYGTASRFVVSIQRDGLKPGQRHHVHLSASVETARLVGARHGTPVVFAVDAKAMHDAGIQFLLSANGVWLTDHVPPQYLQLMPEA